MTLRQIDALTFRNGEFVLKMTDGREKLVDFEHAMRHREKASPVLKQGFQKIYEITDLVEGYGIRNVEGMFPFLDAHQRTGISWILSRRRSYLNHAPGAGKTVQAIGAAILSGLDKVLFIAPPSLVSNWKREIKIWMPEFSKIKPDISVITDSATKADVNWRARFLICPDSMLTKSWVMENLLKRNSKFVAVDEASRFKESLSQRTVALFGGKLIGGDYWPGLIRHAVHAVLLDGSPAPSRAMDLWAPVYGACPEAIEFMDQKTFGFRYCGATMNSFGKFEFKFSSNETELKERLTKNFMHIVPESALSHPERRRSILMLDGAEKQPSLKTWEKTHLSEYRMTDFSESNSQGELAGIRQDVGLAKIKATARYVKEKLEKGESIILFAWHREVIARLATALKSEKPCVVIGGTEQHIRDLYFKDFQAGARKLIIGNILAMGRGVNLQKADRVIFAEFAWSNETNLQAEKRASRKGSTKSFVRCEYLCLPNSLDGLVLKSVFRKEEMGKRLFL